MSEARYLVLGTAGHIDHGKTTLIRTLTGIDCDTMEEEKQRGITINLGFAHLELEGLQLGVVDVPGHARFIRNMVAGAAGIDLVMLVVAADDGVMPQTREHLAITRLLGVKAGLVALTKADMVDEELIELAEADVEELIEGSFLEGCPIIPVSAQTGEGMDELRQAISELANQVAERAEGELFRMPIDRSFSIKGAGTVVTGTTLAGVIKIDDELELMPSGKKTRVRGLQMHGEQAKAAGAGHRLAVNLVGVDKDDIQRGDVLVAPGTLEATYMFDAEVELLPGEYTPPRRGTEANLHIGTVEVSAKLFPLEGDVLAAGLTHLVQFRLQAQVALAAGDRFIIRDSTGRLTIGGGSVLDAHPTKHRRKRAEAAEQLEELRATELSKAVLHEALKQPFGISRTELGAQLHASTEALAQAIEDAQQAGLNVHGAGRQQMLSAPLNRARIIEAAIEVIGAHFKANPLSAKGLSSNELVKAIDKQGSGLTAQLVTAALTEAAESGQLESVNDGWTLPDREVELSAKDEQAIATLLSELNASATPEQPDDIYAELKVDRKRARQLLNYLVQRGDVLSATGMFFGAKMVAEVRSKLKAHLSANKGVTVSDFNKLSGATRKYGVPLLHILEQDGMLVRDGDLRCLNPKWKD